MSGWDPQADIIAGLDSSAGIGALTVPHGQIITGFFSERQRDMRAIGRLVEWGTGKGLGDARVVPSYGREVCRADLAWTLYRS
jgi:hypothetical protein